MYFETEKTELEQAICSRPSSIHGRNTHGVGSIPDDRRQRIRAFFHDQAKADAMIAQVLKPELEDVAMKNRIATARLVWQPRHHDPHLHKWLHRIDVPTLLLWAPRTGCFQRNAALMRKRCARQRRISTRWSTASSKMPIEMLVPPGYSGIDAMKRIRAHKVTGKTMTIEELNKTGVVIIGSANTVREKLAEYQDLASFNTSLTKTQFGTLPDDMTRANMTAIAEEILPAFRGRLPQGKREQAAE